MKKEVAVGTVIQDAQRSNHDHPRRWSRSHRAQLFDQYLELHAQGLSVRQAAKALEVPRSTLQAWRVYHESLDEHPVVVTFFHSAPGLAFLHRLVVAIHLVCTEVGACGIRLVCLLLNLTALDRFVAASYGSQQHVNRQVEELADVVPLEVLPALALLHKERELFEGELGRVGVNGRDRARMT